MLGRGVISPPPPIGIKRTGKRKRLGRKNIEVQRKTKKPQRKKKEEMENKKEGKKEEEK